MVVLTRGRRHDLVREVLADESKYKPLWHPRVVDRCVMITSIELATGNGSAKGFLALPDGDGKVGGIVVVHEWWGINADIERIVNLFASNGLLSLAVDLYGGKSTADAAEAFGLSNELKTPAAIEVMAAGVSALKEHPRSNGKVAITGFCLGGAMALAAALNLPTLNAAVPFYGSPKEEYANGFKTNVPILGHYAKNDGFVSIEKARLNAKRVNENGGSFELCEYDAGHAFMREADPTAYHAESAALAWERTMAFLKKHVMG